MREDGYDEPDFVRPQIDRPHGYLQSFAEVLKSIELHGPAPRAETWKGIGFRSKLEARYARHLDWMGDQWVYEPRVYGPRGRGYLPDFQILGGRPKFIEVKPTLREVRAAVTGVLVA